MVAALRTTAMLGLASLTAGAGECRGEAGPGAAPPDPSEAIDTLGQSTSRPKPAMFAFRFDPGLAEQTGLRVGILVGSATADQCRTYEQAGDELDAVWRLAISLTGTAPGTYQVTNSADWETLEGAAVVDLVRREVAYPAVRGTVRVDSAPADEREAMGATVMGSVDLEFADPPVRTLACEGGFDVASGQAALSRCECAAADGATFTCEPAPGANACCTEVAPDGFVRLETAFEAELCPALCAFSEPSLASRCSSLYR